MSSTHKIKYNLGDAGNSVKFKGFVKKKEIDELFWRLFVLKYEE